MSAVGGEKAPRTEGINQRRNVLLQLRQRRAWAERFGPACGLRPAGEERPVGAG
jgi:hypothetical protein